jgi:hypothetical protein
MNRQSKKQMTGCGQQIIFVPLVFALLYWGNSAPVANPDLAIPIPLPLVVLALAGVVWFIASILRGKVSFTTMLIVMAIGAGIIWLNGTDAMPGVDNPCPGDELIVVVGGQCVGMDADANRSWLENTLGGGQ